jgi:hypothetical protein
MRSDNVLEIFAWVAGVLLPAAVLIALFYFM